MNPFWFSLVRESYGLTIKPLGRYESSPNHLAEPNTIEILNEYEVRAMIHSMNVLLDRHTN